MTLIKASFACALPPQLQSADNVREINAVLFCSTWKFLVFVHAKIGELKVKDLSQKLQGISGFIFHLQLCEGQQLKHQILLKSNTE